MSSIVEYFVAPDDVAAAAAIDDGPDESWDVRSYGNFDAFTAMIEWESILTGRTFDDVLDDGGPRWIGENQSGEGPQLFAASRELQRALAEATPGVLAELRRGRGFKSRHPDKGNPRSGPVAWLSDWPEVVLDDLLWRNSGDDLHRSRNGGGFVVRPEQTSRTPTGDPGCIRHLASTADCQTVVRSTNNWRRISAVTWE
jgi:hypothetical protein